MEPDSTPRRSLLSVRSLSHLVFGVSVVLCLVSWAIGLGHDITEPHGFRQAQTAVSVTALLHGGPWLLYETPIMGPPWSIPFEFPLYQWLVALLTLATGLAVAPAGRVVSIVAFGVVVGLAWKILEHWRVAAAERRLVLGLLLLSPLYLFWTRTFMIESLALALALGYLLAALKLEERGGWARAGLVAGLGIVAALVKITTFVPFAAIASLFALLACVRVWRAGTPLPRAALTLAARALVLGIAPLLVEVAWNTVSDGLKQANPIAHDFINSQALSAWNFGTLAQRLDLHTWTRLLSGERLSNIVGWSWPFWLSLPLALALRAARVPYLLSLAGFLLAPLIFTNLHFVHDYYQYENAIFLLAATAWLVIAMTRHAHRAWRIGGYVLLLATLGMEFDEYAAGYLRFQQRPIAQWEGVAAALRDHTPPSAVIMVTGADWNSVIPFAADRRAVMNRSTLRPTDPAMQRTLASLAAAHDAIGGLVFCGGTSRDGALIQAWREAVFGVTPTTGFDADGCKVHVAGVLTAP